MRSTVLIFAFTLLTAGFAFSQNVVNGGFEDVIVTELDYTYPENWMPLDWTFDGITCDPYINRGEVTEDSHTGNHAVKMETFLCTFENSLGVEAPRTSGYFLGDPLQLFPLYQSIEFNERPEHLSFFYKFLRENSDSAFVEVVLFNYESVATTLSDWQNVDTIAYSSARITQESETYAEFTLPIDYLSDEMPSYLKIYFSSGNNLNCNENNCTPGTTLLVDDVSLSGGTLDTKHATPLDETISLYPNPTHKTFHIKQDGNTVIGQLQILDQTGRVMKKWAEPNQSYPIDELPSGYYHVMINTSHGIVTEKLIRVD